MKRKLFFLFLILFSFSCARKEPEPEPRPFTVSSIRPQVRDLSAFSYFTGVVRAKEEVKVYSRVEGKIDQKLVRKGDEVSKDQALFKIDRDVVGYRFERARVESPLSGRVSMVYIDRGDRVTPQEPLALLQDDSMVRLRIWAGEKDYPRIREGQLAYLEVGAYPDKEFQGEVSQISPFFDSATHTALVEVEVDNPDGKLKPGMFSEIRIEVDRRPQVLTVLFDATLEDEEGEYVYLVDEGRAEKRYIETGLRSGEYLEVVSGLGKEEEIAYRGKEFLEEGSRVRVR